MGNPSDRRTMHSRDAHREKVARNEVCADSSWVRSCLENPTRSAGYRITHEHAVATDPSVVYYLSRWSYPLGEGSSLIISELDLVCSCSISSRVFLGGARWWVLYGYTRWSLYCVGFACPSKGPDVP